MVGFPLERKYSESVDGILKRHNELLITFQLVAVVCRHCTGDTIKSGRYAESVI